MRITEANTRNLADRSLLLVELATDEEIVGRSLCRGVDPDTVTGLADAVLVGRDPCCVSALWDEMGEACASGSRRYAERARACLDIACWDAKARYHDEPLWRSLGGGRPRAVAYGSWQARSAEGQVAGEGFRNLAAQGGFARGLLRLNGQPGDDATQLGALHDILRAQATPVDLMLDFAGTWPGEAIRRISALEADFDITWVRGVARYGDFRSCKRVADSIRAAVCAGGDLGCESAFLPVLHSGAANVVEIDLQRLGVTGALRVAEAAYGYELPVTLGAAPGNLPVQIASVLPNFMGMEVVDAAPSSNGVGSAAGFECGRATAGDAPGTGIEIRQGVAQ